MGCLAFPRQRAGRKKGFSLTLLQLIRSVYDSITSGFFWIFFLLPQRYVNCGKVFVHPPPHAFSLHTVLYSPVRYFGDDEVNRADYCCHNNLVIVCPC